MMNSKRGILAMKKRLVSLVLTLIQILVDLNIVMIGAATLLAPIFMLFVPSLGLSHELFDYHSWWSFLLQFLCLIALAVLTIILMLGIRNLLSNINDGLYFVDQNMLAIRQILWASTAIFILQCITTTVFRLCDLHDRLKGLTFQTNDFSNSLTFIAIFFLVYLIFKRGLTLQKESDEII